MGRAIDSVLTFSTQGAAAPFPTALAATGGDSLAVRSFDRSKRAYLQAVLYNSNAVGTKTRVQSPLLHDNVTGLTWEPAELPSQWMLPPEGAVELRPIDTLSVFGQCTAAATIQSVLVNYYEDLDGVSANLFNWADIRGLITYIKSVEVALNAIAVGAWTDTLLTATENQLHADEYYAVLGYQTSQALTAVGVKGSATGNLRVCGPGPVSSLDIAEYFITFSEKSKRPCIPVFNANDRTAFYISAANNVAVGGGAAEVYPVLAQLSRRP